MMSWQPRMTDRNAFMRGPRVGRVSRVVRMWNDERQAELDGRLPELVVDRRVVVLDRRLARHHHAAQAERLDLLDVGDALLGRAHRRLADAEQARAGAPTQYSAIQRL